MCLGGRDPRGKAALEAMQCRWISWSHFTTQALNLPASYQKTLKRCVPVSCAQDKDNAWKKSLPRHCAAARIWELCEPARTSMCYRNPRFHVMDTYGTNVRDCDFHHFSCFQSPTCPSRFFLHLEEGVPTPAGASKSTGTCVCALSSDRTGGVSRGASLSLSEWSLPSVAPPLQLEIKSEFLKSTVMSARCHGHTHADQRQSAEGKKTQSDTPRPVLQGHHSRCHNRIQCLGRQVQRSASRRGPSSLAVPPADTCLGAAGAEETPSLWLRADIRSADDLRARMSIHQHSQ